MWGRDDEGGSSTSGQDFAVRMHEMGMDEGFKRAVWNGGLKSIISINISFCICISQLFSTSHFSLL